MSKSVAIIVGSLRKRSLNRRVAQALVALSPESLQYHFVEIGDLPLYDEDLETDDAPASWTRFRREVRAADAVLFVTPEYNRSMPGGLKNAIDVGSRPYGQSVFSGKPAGVISASPGPLGGFGANHHLRQALVFLDMRTMAQPEAYLGKVTAMFDEEGGLREGAGELLRTYAQAFATWCQSVDALANR